MKIAAINASPKTGASNSGIILDKLNGYIGKRCEIVNYSLSSKGFSEAVYSDIVASDAVVLAFPLYVDALPSNLLKMLIELEGYISRNNANDIVVYAIINNGFYEGEQTRIAFEIIQNWCDRARLKFGGGIGQGAGETIGVMKNSSISKTLFGALERELNRLAEKIESTAAYEIKYLTPFLPRFLWSLAAKYAFWRPLAAKNKLSMKDIEKRIA
ncbi:MAG: hypothetical protein LBC09_00395 [Helicobacteraceae bacterium]|jgi:multimeric flavodoxin WrbA|nr:hypothetical protein [Helicobacteraceae bacterium]